ncbi:MAG: hypothetical protein AAF742_06915 [Pseudomonadota bacterium]
MSPASKILGTIVVFLIIVVGMLFWRETTYGSPPAVAGDTASLNAREVAVVANAVEGTVSVVDLQSMEIAKTINVIPDGTKATFFRDPSQSILQPIVEGKGGLNFAQDTDLSPDGQTLFVSRGFLGDVVAIDIGSSQIVWRTPIKGVRADHMDISPDGKKLYVSGLIYSNDLVQIIDTKTGRITGAFKAGRWPHDVHAASDGKRLHVASLGDMTIGEDERGTEDHAYEITEVDAQTLRVLRRHPFDAGVRPFALSADKSTVFAQLSNTHAVVKRDLTTGNDIARIDLPVKDGVTQDDWDFEAPHHGLALTKDEKRLCIAGRASDYAAILQADDLSLEAAVDVGDAPSWAVIASDDRTCILANNRSDDVSFVDLETGKETKRLDVGRGPKHITVGSVTVPLN